MLVSIGDREADIYELIEMALGDPLGPKLLIRATQNRALAEEQGHLWSKVSSQGICANLGVRVPRSGNKAARETTLAIRLAQVLNLIINGLFFSDYLGLQSLFSCCLDRAGQPGSELGG